MRFKAKKKDYQLIVKVKISFGESFDEKELNKFSRIYIRGFLKPKVIKKNYIEYSGPVGISLYEKTKKTISKRDFLFIIEHILVAVQKLKENDLSIDHLVLSMQNVYINEITREVQFLYVPINEKQNNVDLMEFIENIVYSLKPATDEDAEFISRFIYFFRSLKPFDINKIEQFIAKEDRSVVNSIKKNNVGQSGFMTDKQKHYYEHYAVDSLGDEPTGLLQDVKKSYEETDILSIEDDDATQLLNDDATKLLVDDNDTALLDESLTVTYPTLLRILTDETISINKPVFRLGKEESYVDYSVKNNSAVSRSHADIITRGKQYFVKDLNSKNHTFINEKEIPVQCEIEIHNGDKLKLANEEFIFKV